MISIVSIDREDFDREQIPSMSHGDEFSKKYYLICEGDIKVCKLATSSEISPSVLDLGGFFGVGCDLLVGFFDKKSNSVIKELSLPCFFYSFEESEEYIFIVCEVVVIALYKENINEFKTYEFIELIKCIEINESTLSIFFIDNSHECIDL